MKSRRWIAVMAIALPFAAPLLSMRARAGDVAAPAPSGSAHASPDAGPPLPSFDEAPFSDEKTPMPAPPEWASAPRVAVGPFDGKTSFGTTCEARRLREWLRLRCTGVSTGAISLLGGAREGLSFQLDPATDEWSTFPTGAEVVLPMRRGDRRVIEWLQIAFGYKGMTSLEPFVVISEHWPPGDARPTVVVL